MIIRKYGKSNMDMNKVLDEMCKKFGISEKLILEHMRDYNLTFEVAKIDLIKMNKFDKEMKNINPADIKCRREQVAMTEKGFTF